MFPGQFKHLYLLLISQARCLACSSERNEEVHATGNLSVYKGSIGVIIDFSVTERSYKGCTTASEFCITHMSISSEVL